MQKLDNKFKHILPVILLLLLITIIIGVTYAVYTLTTTGNENSITTGLVSMSYTESTNVIDIKNALPMSDAEGKTQSNYFDFSVTSNLTLGENDIDTPVYYSIELEPLSIDTGYNALEDNQIKIYLEDTTNNNVLLNSKLISDLSNYVLYNTNHNHKYNTNSITTNYRLRAWIDYSVDASNWSSSNKYEYKFRINVNSDTNGVGYTTPEYCFEYTTNDTDMTAEIRGYKCYAGNSYGYETITNLVIPETLGGYTVTSTYDPDYYVNQEGAFQSKGLTSVKMPNSLVEIGDFAFHGNNLTSVTIPNSVTTIGLYAFQENNLVSITLGSSVTTINNRVFSDNPNLTSIVVDSDNTVYDSRNNSNAIIETSTNTLIQGCKTTVIPNTVTIIGSSAFSEMGLTEITIPNSVTTIGDAAFSSNNLTSVTIGNSVTTISGSAFSNNNLTSVTIPDSVTTIGNAAFSNNNLQYVLINEGSNLTSIDYNAFPTSNYSHTLTIYNNSGKSFDWGSATQRRNGYSFVTGSIPSYTPDSYSSFGPVEVTTGTPS